MGAVVRTTLAALLSVFAAHALAYALVWVLPEASIVALGLNAGQGQVLEAFRTEQALQPYPSVLLDLLHGNLGKTLDNVPVEDALAIAVQQSGPRIVIAILLCIILALAYALVSKNLPSRTARVSSALAFLPAFVIPVFLYGAYLQLEITNGGGWRWFILQTFCIVSVALTPAALLTFQAHTSMKRLLQSAHAARHRAMGANIRRVRLRLIRNLIYELMPSIEKLVTMMITLSIFAELLLNVYGVGTLTARAVSRSDWALILGLVVLFAGIINLARVFSEMVRALLRGHG